MNWHLKVAGYKLLAAVPGGTAFYRFSQRHLTKSLSPNPARLGNKIDVGIRYLEWLSARGKTAQLLEGVHLDFGSGWHPTIPLLFYSLGLKRQYLFDVTPVLDGRLLQQTLAVFLPMVNDAQWPHRAKVRRLPPQFGNGDWRAYLEGLGLTYHAPYADVFPTLAGALDVVTSTQVLLHVPPAAMPVCFKQIHNSLKPGGLFMGTIHLRDILAGCYQPGLTKYQQLRYSPQTWERWINSPLISFNRLKAPDYKQFLEQAGFEIQHFEVEPGTAEELKELEQVPIADCFRRYAPEELAARHLFFVAQKR